MMGGTNPALTDSALVVGSINVDSFVTVSRLPQRGETVITSGDRRGLGGKGANQAIAIRALGVRTHLVGAVGDDEAGQWLVESLAECGVDTDSVRSVTGSSGEATVVVEQDTGDNLILVSPAANAAVGPADIERAMDADPSRIVVTQQELTEQAVTAALLRARQDGRFTVLNAAPARVVDDERLALVDLLVVNRGEVLAMSGEDDVTRAAAVLRGRGAGAVMVTLGGAGVLLDAGDGGSPLTIPSPAVDAVVDSTGAGDIFTGAVAAALVRGRTVHEAAEIGVRAGSWSVQYAGVRAPGPADIDLQW
jgi:ribokinase